MNKSNTSKRKLDFEVPDVNNKVSDTNVSDTNDLSSKEDSQPRNDGHFSTPVKRRLAFDFWNPKVSTGIKINELQIGNYMGQPLCVRVTLKPTMKKTKVGNLLSFHGCDEGGEIAFVAFGEEADKFNGIIQINKVYSVDNFTVKPEAQGFPSGTGHLFQVTLNKNSSVIKNEGVQEVAAIPFKISMINEIEKMEVNQRTDILAVLVHDWGQEFTSKGISKRDFSLTDSSKSTILMTLWREEAECFEGKINSLIAIRKAMVSDYLSVKSLNMRSDTLIWVDPKLPEAIALKQWYDNEMDNRKMQLQNQDI